MLVAEKELKVKEQVSFIGVTPTTKETPEQDAETIDFKINKFYHLARPPIILFSSSENGK